ncbi:winged helix-turn-helix transcriptional regulator [Agrobacterium rhizogenes]|nr:winged helix-turn-helix transcriptional regulator [Rhizobium rhizogenes]NTJ78069.1 winged helix-turn-helix transcriptional regulator [Rhizobium rhizogenes]
MKTLYAFETEAVLLGALANPIRLQVLVFLLEGEWSVMDLANKIGVNQPALSRHLQQLRELKIVNTRRDANFIFYSCDHPLVRAVLRVLNVVAE